MYFTLTSLFAVQNLARVSNEVSNDDLGTHNSGVALVRSTTLCIVHGPSSKATHKQHRLCLMFSGT